MFTQAELNFWVSSGIQEIIEKSPLLAGQEKNSRDYNGRHSVVQLLRESFETPCEHLSESGIVIWFLDCKHNLRESLMKAFYNVKLSNTICLEIEKNLSRLVGQEAWDSYTNFSDKELQNA